MRQSVATGRALKTEPVDGPIFLDFRLPSWPSMRQLALMAPAKEKETQQTTNTCNPSCSQSRCWPDRYSKLRRPFTFDTTFFPGSQQTAVVGPLARHLIRQMDESILTAQKKTDKSSERVDQSGNKIGMNVKQKSARATPVAGQPFVCK
jgi:hypothetical protein